MNYIKQLNAFYSTLDYKPLSVNAIAVYFILLQIANNAGWIDEIKVANNVILNKCNISEKQLTNARNNLVNQGYIEYEKGKAKIVAPKYKIKQLYTDIITPNDTLPDEGNEGGNVGGNKGGNVGGNAGGNKGGINKQNKTKQNIIYSKSKIVPPTLEEVNAYVEEKQLNVDVKYFYDYFTDGNWIDSKGNPVRNWKQKILTWAKHNNNVNANVEVKEEKPQKIYNERGEELQW